jgi:hypothetical protein
MGILLFTNPNLKSAIENHLITLSARASTFGGMVRLELIHLQGTCARATLIPEIFTKEDLLSCPVHKLDQLKRSE